MSSPKLSQLFLSREPSAVRLAQMEFAKRTDGVGAVNTSIGNVSLPMHPALIKRMKNLAAVTSPFKDGIVRYTATVGMDETREAFKNIIASSGFETNNLHVQIVDGGSHGMELVILGVCGEAGSDEQPLLVIDPAYSNYISFAERTGRRIVALKRELQADGQFSLPDFTQIEALIEAEKPGAILVIPYDNPTGQFFAQTEINKLAELAVKHNLWLIGDEAYRELGYSSNHQTSSVWGVTESSVPGILGRRISIESASKVWNACGLRMGAVVTDNLEFHTRCVAENTANLCPPAIEQYIFGALAHESHENLQTWYKSQRAYYAPMLIKLRDGLKQILPQLIVSAPAASLYSVVDVRNLVDENFQAQDFVLYCAREGKVEVDGQEMTLLVAPMAGFYNVKVGQANPGRTQMRIALVETPARMKLVPELFAKLLKQYLLAGRQV